MHLLADDQLSLWRMGKLGGSELQTPWTDGRKIWRGWLCRRYHRACQKCKWSPVWENGWNITLVQFLIFCDSKFCTRLGPKPHNRFSCCLIHRTSVPGYCIPRGIKLPFPPFYPIIKIGENLAKLRARTWLFRALSLSFSSVVARRTKCTSQPSSCLLACNFVKHLTISIFSLTNLAKNLFKP